MSANNTNITTHRIEALANEAGAAGDILMAAICRRALGEGFEDYALSGSERAKVDAMSREEAMAAAAEALEANS